jgi:hypothetical protein
MRLEEQGQLSVTGGQMTGVADAVAVTPLGLCPLGRRLEKRTIVC